MDLLVKRSVIRRDVKHDCQRSKSCAHSVNAALYVALLSQGRAQISVPTSMLRWNLTISGPRFTRFTSATGEITCWKQSGAISSRAHVLSKACARLDPRWIPTRTYATQSFLTHHPRRSAGAGLRCPTRMSCVTSNTRTPSSLGIGASHGEEASKRPFRNPSERRILGLSRPARMPEKEDTGTSARPSFVSFETDSYARCAPEPNGRP